MGKIKTLVMVEYQRMDETHSHFQPSQLRQLKRQLRMETNLSQ